MIIVRAMFNVLNFDGRTAVFGGPQIFLIGRKNFEITLDFSASLR